MIREHIRMALDLAVLVFLVIAWCVATGAL